MARLARIVVPDCPHHIVQRGNRRQNVFFNENDRHFYLETLNENAKKYGIVFWAYCLMSNHVHFIAVPKNEDSFARGLGQAHKKYSRYINKREGWSGHLWQSRFLSFPLNEEYLYSALRYVENNPVRAGIVDRAEDFAWSSARAHVAGEEDFLLSDCYLLNTIHEWGLYLRGYTGENHNILFRKYSSTGRPLGDEEFISELESKTGKNITKKKSGPKK